MNIYDAHVGHVIDALFTTLAVASACAVGTLLVLYGMRWLRRP